MNTNEDFSSVEQVLTDYLGTEVPTDTDNKMRTQLVWLRENMQSRSVTVAVRPDRPRLLSRRVLTWAVAASIALVLLTALNWVRSQPTTAWAEVTAAVENQQWLHAVITISTAQIGEAWSSPRDKIIATKQEGRSMFIDQRLKTIDIYRDSDNVILREPLDEITATSAAQTSLLLHGLFESGKKSWKIGDLTVRRKGEKTVEKDGKRWLEHSFTMEEPENKMKGEIVLQSDPKTRLPFHLRSTYRYQNRQEPLTAEYKIDYPKTGPESIFSLGALKTATFVDKTVPGDADQLIAGIEANRYKFDKYHAVVLEYSESSLWYQPLGYKQVWQDGNHWRIERIQGIPRRDKAPSDGGDRTKWWFDLVASHPFIPVLASDGESVCRYEVVWGEWDKKSMELHRRPVKSIKKKITRRKAYLGECMYLPPLMAHLDLPLKHYYPPFTPTVNTAPESGPEGTVLLELRRPPAKKVKEIVAHRYWIDPLRGYMVMQYEQVLSTDGQGGEKTDSHLIVDEVALSPKGHWYPTVLRSKDRSVSLETGKREDMIYKYYLEFVDELPDSLFDLSAEPVIKKD